MRLLKEELAWPTYKRFQFISNTMLFKTVICNSKELKNRAILSYQNIVCIAMWSLVMYSNYFECNLSVKRPVINLSAILLLEVCLYLLLYIG